MEHKSGFDAYLRSGEEQGLRQIEQKSFSTGSDPDGGFLVPEELSSEIGRRLAAISPIRALSDGSADIVLHLQKNRSLPQERKLDGWVKPITDRKHQRRHWRSCSSRQWKFTPCPLPPPALLEDSAVDLDSWIAEEVETVFAAQEGTAFVTGDGINKPRGFLNTPTVDEESLDMGQSWLCDKPVLIQALH